MAKRYEIETESLAQPRGLPETLSLPDSGPLVVPGGGLLSDAVYAHVDGDLLIELADGTRLVVEGYFDLPHSPPLVTDAGAHIGADVVGALAGFDQPAGLTQVPVAAPIGRVETVEGEVEIVRADGTRVEAEAGGLIARDDRVETGPDGNAGFLFADESTFSVGGGTRAVFDDLVFDPDTGAAHATFVVQQGTFSFSGGGIAAVDGAFSIKTPTATVSVDGASGAGRVEADGATTLTYLAADDAQPGILKATNPGGTELLDQSYETLTVEEFFQPPSSVFRMGPRDAAAHFGDAVTALPDARAAMPGSLLDVERPGAVAGQAVPFDEYGNMPDDASGDLRSEIQTDRDAAFEIAARKAAIARAARDAADEALGDAATAEQSARMQAAQAQARAEDSAQTAEQLKARALEILEEADRRDKTFEDAVRQAETASAAEDDAARAVAETDLAEAQAAERLAQAEETVRQALEAAERARDEALTVLEEAKQKEEAFAAAQRAAQQAEAEEEKQALAVAEADAAEEAAAAALRAAEAAAEASRQEAAAAERVAQEASTAAEVVETVVARELAAIDPDLLRPPAADDPASSKGDWITRARASMDVASAALAAGEEAARGAYRDALDEGASIEEALERAVVAAEAYGGAASADRVIAAGPDGLLDESEADDGAIVIAGGGGGGFSGAGDNVAGAVSNDVLIGGGGGDTLAGGAGFGGVDGLFGFGFSFTPIVLRLRGPSDDDDDRDDPVSRTVTARADEGIGSGLADFLVGTNETTAMGGREGDDFLYGDTPTNYLSGTHNAGNALLNPTFSAGAADRISGGGGDDMIWGGEGADTIYGDVPGDPSGFSFSLGADGNGADTIMGGGGGDTIAGQGGADVLMGEDGDDTFIMGDDDGADDTVWGGDTGTDTVDYSDAGASVSVDLGAGAATGAGIGTDALNGIENAIGTGFDDTLTGSADANELSGGGGADTIAGAGGDDNIFGYAGDDVLIGGEGADNLTGGSGADEFRFAGGSGADALAKAASLGTDLINDYNASEADLFMLSDGDFAFGDTGTLTGGTNYFEADTTAIGAGAQNLSGGVANAGIVVIGSAAGGDGAEVWYTDDASAMSTANSYQIAEVEGADRSTLDAGDFSLKT